MAFNPSEYANNGAGRDISQFVKIATQVSEYRNAEFVRDLNSKTLQLRLSNPGISDLKIAQFEDGEYAKLYSKRLGFRVQAPMPQTDFAQQQALRGTGKIQGQEAVAQYGAEAPMRAQELEDYQKKTDIETKASRKLIKSREKAYRARPRAETSADRTARTKQTAAEQLQFDQQDVQEALSMNVPISAMRVDLSTKGYGESEIRDVMLPFYYQRLTEAQQSDDPAVWQHLLDDFFEWRNDIKGLSRGMLDEVEDKKIKGME